MSSLEIIIQSNLVIIFMFMVMVQPRRLVPRIKFGREYPLPINKNHGHQVWPH